MGYEYNLNDEVYITVIVGANGKIINRLKKENTNFYQIKVLEGKYEGKLLWFAEHEIRPLSNE